MTDTSAETQARYEQMVMSLSPAVADMSQGQLRVLLTSLSSTFVVDVDSAERAFVGGYSLSLIHSGT